MDSSIAGQLFLQVILIALNAFFACAEIAILSVNENKLAAMAEDGNGRAKKLQKLTSQPARFLSTIQVAITLAGFLASAFAAENFAGKIVEGLVKLGVTVAPATLRNIAVVAVTVILSYITLVFGELVPKRVAMKKSESLALMMAGIITLVSKLFAPIVWLLTVSTNGILRLFHIDPNADDEEMDEEDILMMVNAGNQKGVIDTEETEIIQNVFEFDSLPVSEFATHRTDIDILWTEDSIEEWEKIIHETRHTLYPVCGETVDDVVGILNTKDYFRLTEKTQENVMKNAVKPAYFVPETIFADVLFRQMKKTHYHFAVVLDEYGGVVGIVTMNDILEQIVGDLDDDMGAKEPEIEAIGENKWKILGSAPLDEVAEALDVELPEDDYVTFGGLVFGMHGSVPDDGSKFEIDIPPLHVSVVVIQDHKMERAIVTKSVSNDTEEEE